MADRYRVGTGGNWNSTTYWSTTSGGAGGASVPGSADNAIFDSNTPVGTVTVDVAVDIVTLNCSGWTGTLLQSGFTMQIAGNWTVPTGMTFTANGLVQFDGSGVNQILTMDGDYNTFDDLQHSMIHSGSWDLDLGSDIRTTGVFTIDTNCRVDGGSSGYDIYIQGAGAGNFVLNGWVYALTTGVIFEIDTGGTVNIPGATGWDVNGSLTGAVMTVRIIANVTVNVRLTGNLSDILIFRLEPTSTSAGATINFYTDNYDIHTSVTMEIGGDVASENDGVTFTSYWGSSTITFTDNATQKIRWQWSKATHNLQSATFIGGSGANAGNYGFWSVYGTSTAAVDIVQTFNVGTSQVFCRGVGESWMGLGAHNGVAEFYDLELSYPGNVSMVYIPMIVHHQMTLGDNGSSSETSIEFQAHYDIEDLIVTAAYANIVWEGYEGSGISYFRQVPTVTGTFDFQIRSRVPTSQAPLYCDEYGGSMVYTNVQDSDLSGNPIDVTDGTNTDSGNNSSFWMFMLTAAPVKGYNYRRRRT